MGRQKETSATKGTARAFLIGNRVHVVGSFIGDLPKGRDMGVQHIRSRHFVARPTRAFRDPVAKIMRTAIRRVTKKEPLFLIRVHFFLHDGSREEILEQKKTDFDTAYHQMQDALSKDIFGLDDRGTVPGYQCREDSGEEHGYLIHAEYAL